MAFRAASIDPLSGEVERKFDHRRAYLEREGDLGGGRGTLRRVDGGPCAVEAGRSLVRVELRGVHLAGRFVFREVKEDRWQVDFIGRCES